ncbi:MAG: oxygen-independent coproporphyrinogen III oxidase [Pontixanthobacter sp.]
MTTANLSAQTNGMWPYIPDLLATPVPRYTSFPTAAEFGSGISEGDFLDAIAKAYGNISLYVHIPYCDKICWYCGCNTGAANKRQRLASYLDALHSEIALIAGHLPATARVTRISFGGGSPNAIAPVDFIRLFQALVIAFPLANPVISTELDPRSLSEDWGPVLKSIGVTRASLGVQTFAPHCQAAIGRVQPLPLIERSTETLRKAGVSSLNFDLMYGLPGQSEDDLIASLDQSVALGADRLAVFGYAHVPHLIPRQRRIGDSALPGTEARFAMAQVAYQHLTQAGYVPVGFDHFAKPEDPLAEAARSGNVRRNFQGFSDDTADCIIGLGASSISNFPGLSVQNEKNSGRYRMLLSQDRIPLSVGINRSRQDQLLGKIIEDLLCQGRAKPGQAAVEASRERLAPFIEAGVCRFEGGELVILPHGLPYARGIAATFDPYRQSAPRRFSSAI